MHVAGAKKANLTWCIATGCTELEQYAVLAGFVQVVTQIKMFEILRNNLSPRGIRGENPWIS